MAQTREEHIEWCKKRAKAEMAYSHRAKDGIVSMMSDLNKHSETYGHPAMTLLTMELMRNPNMSIEEATKLIDGCR